MYFLFSRLSSIEKNINFHWYRTRRLFFSFREQENFSIEHDFIVKEGIDHNPLLFYEKAGEKLMRFHQEN